MSGVIEVKIHSERRGYYWARDNDDVLYRVEPRNKWPSRSKVGETVEVIHTEESCGFWKARLPPKDEKEQNDSWLETNREVGIEWDGTPQDLGAVSETKDVSAEEDIRGSKNDLL